MNVKLIFVFTICVVLPNGLYSDDKQNIQVNRQALINHWMPQNKKDSVFQVDGEGNILIKLLIQCGSKKNKIFVKKFKLVGVNIAVTYRVNDGEDNDEVIIFFSKIFGVPKDALEIVSGLKSKKKTLKLKHGFLELKDAVDKVVNNYMTTK